MGSKIKEGKLGINPLNKIMIEWGVIFLFNSMRIGRYKLGKERKQSWLPWHNLPICERERGGRGGESYLTPFASGTSRRIPLVMLFFERVSPIRTGVSLFFFCFRFFFLLCIFSCLYKNSKQFQILNTYKFKFWTDFKWNKFSNSEQISNGTNFQILNIF
jgi:hypothetical protein